MFLKEKKSFKTKIKLWAHWFFLSRFVFKSQQRINNYEIIFVWKDYTPFATNPKKKLVFRATFFSQFACLFEKLKPSERYFNHQLNSALKRDNSFHPQMFLHSSECMEVNFGLGARFTQKKRHLFIKPLFKMWKKKQACTCVCALYILYHKPQFRNLLKETCAYVIWKVET